MTSSKNMFLIYGFILGVIALHLYRTKTSG